MRVRVRACVRACVCTAGSLTHGVGGPEATALHGGVGLEAQPQRVGGGADGGRQGGATVFADQPVRLLSPVSDLEGGGRGLSHTSMGSPTSITLEGDSQTCSLETRLSDLTESLV